jgi:hypothetical protein
MRLIEKDTKKNVINEFKQTVTNLIQHTNSRGKIALALKQK